MKLFQTKQVTAAINYGASGGLVLHMMPPGFAKAFPGAPKALTEAPGKPGRPGQFAHLICSDLEKLEKAARRLGVKNIVVHHLHGRGQHIDLFGKPLRKAILMTMTNWKFHCDDQVKVISIGFPHYGDIGVVYDISNGIPKLKKETIYAVRFPNEPTKPSAVLYTESQLKLVEFANG